MSFFSKARWGTLGSILEIRSEVGFGARLLNNLEPAENLSRAEAVVEIGWVDEGGFDLEGVKWYPMINGQIGYGTNRVFVDISGAIFEIYFEGELIGIRAPKDHRISGLPEVVFETALMVFLREKGSYPLHASGGKLEVNMLFPGKTRSGKSTLARWLSESGGKILSDDRVFLSEEEGKITAQGFSHKILLHNAGEEDTGIKNTYNPEDDRDGSSVESMAPEALIYPVFRALEEPELTAISPGESSMRLISLSLPPMNKSHMEIFFKLSRQCRAFELALPELSERPKAVKKLLMEMRFI